MCPAGRSTREATRCSSAQPVREAVYVERCVFCADTCGFGWKLGKDASDDFDDQGHSDDAREMLAKFYKGDLVRIVNQLLGLFVYF
jgi:hypothetical protein